MSITSMARAGAATSLLLASAAAIGVAQDTKDKDKDKNELQKCEKPIGTLAVHEPQQDYLYALQRYNLGSPVGLIRMMIQQSNCFVVVERGVAMQNLQQERALARSGEMQQEENIGGGQMKAAEFILTPAVVFDNPNSGGAGGAIGGLLGRKVGVVGGGLKFKEAQTSMLIADSRTSVQVAAAEGKAKKTDFALGGFAWAGLGVAGGGYSNTAEGKVIAASFLDNYNNIVTSLRSNATLMARAERFKGAGLEGDQIKAGAVFADGDVLMPKIDNIKLFAEPKDGARALATLKTTDKLVYLGEEKDGFLKVQGSDAEGWVKKSLVKK